MFILIWTLLEINQDYGAQKIEVKFPNKNWELKRDQILVHCKMSLKNNVFLKQAMEKYRVLASARITSNS